MNQVISSILVLLLWFQPELLASPFQWADTIGGTGTSTARSIAIDLNNNLYACGQMDGSFQAGNKKISGKNGFLIKYGSAGTVLWAVPLPGLVCKSLSIDAYQNVCIAGFFSDTAHIDSVTLISSGLTDFFLVKFDNQGNLVWAKEGGGLGNDYAFSVANDISGNTFITGSFEDYINFDQNNSILSLGEGDMFVVEYDSSGNFIWAGNGGGSGADAGIAICADLSGNVFVTGSFNGQATFHNNSIQSTGSRNIFIVKYSPVGYQLSVHTAGGGGDDIPTAMALDGSGNVYISGVFNGTAGFGDKSITSSADDGFVAAYDNSLNINWLNKMGGPGNDAALGIKSDWQSNIFVTGVFTGTADFSGSSLMSEGNTDIFITKYDAAGRLSWTERAGGAGADSSFSVSNDFNDLAYIIGSIRGDADFGNISLAADSGGSFFVAQMKPDPTGIKIPIDDRMQMQVFPNPSQGLFNIEGNALADGSVLVKLRDITGRNIVPEMSMQGQGGQINLQNYPDGIYFLTLETNEGFYTEKLMKTGL